jgi:hypothetical protein
LSLTGQLLDFRITYLEGGCMDFKIISINLEIDADKFFTEFESKLNDWNNNYSTQFILSQKKVSTRMGKDMMRYELDDSVYNFTILANRNGSKIKFEPFELKDFNRSFYKECTDENISSYEESPNNCFISIFSKICEDNKGTVAAITGKSTILVHNGKIDNGAKTEVMIKGSNGTKYTLETIDEDIFQQDEDEDLPVYVPKIALNEWLDTEYKLKEMISNMDRRQQFETIAAYLISQKNNNKINSFEFSDLFRQTGTFIDMVGGFQNDAIKNLYQFFSDQDNSADSDDEFY